VTASERVRYQKLPGRRRGILRGSGVWLGPDHLLLVRSWRFREEYKRFHMGDIQAIAVAAWPRFHISTRSIGIAVLWLIGFAFASSRGTWAQISIWAVAVALVSAWVYISASCSCVCRIFTAVSHDELPSIYRTWTARKFVSRVKPHIEAAQGVIEGDWADIVDARRIGPPEPAPNVAETGAGNLLQDKEGGARRSSPLSEIFVAMMFVDALFSFATRHSRTTVLTWLGYAMLGIEIGLSIALLIQHNRGRLRAGMQKLVIASILVTGVTWYSPPFIAAMSVATAARTKSAPAPAGTVADTVIQDIDIGAHLLWGLTGIAILLMQREKRTRETFAG
jgi:hypothetical protein